MTELLSVRNLVTEFSTPQGTIRAVDGVDFSILRGEVFGIVGESGCGKSATCRSIIQLFAGASVRLKGSIRLNEKELVGAAPAAMRAVRGREVSMVFQDPMTALNPTMRVGQQLHEAITARGRQSRSDSFRTAIDLLRAMRVPHPESRLLAYPHELSGGLRQRIVIAMALAGNPDLLLADEPTTALDVTVQDQILKLLLSARDARGAAVLLVTHDLGVVAQTCDRVAVMYAGRVVETGPVDDVLKRPQHPYTRALLAARPSIARRGRLTPIQGAPPSFAEPPPGCRFHPRCSLAIEACRTTACELVSRGGDPAHLDACIRNGGPA
jgi:peptide/nickel transport system ATP-binding protein